jgi:hypothetical protein
LHLFRIVQKYFQIEIASNLTFNKKTYIRAYIEYYRHTIDILSLHSDFSILQTAGFGKEYYLKNRSIGTMEIVLVEMKFPNKRKANLLKNSRYESLSMRDWVSHAFQEAGAPASTKVTQHYNHISQCSTVESHG